MLQIVTEDGFRRNLGGDMARTILNISMPESMRSFIETRVEWNYGSISEYIRELVRADQRRFLEEIDGDFSRQRNGAFRQTGGHGNGRFPAKIFRT